MLTAVLDTCALWPSRQRDFFLSLAVEGLYRPVWSSVVLDELRYEEEAKLTGRGIDAGIAAERASRLVGRMGEAFGDASVPGWERLDGTLALPDPDDEHVVAAAVVAGAGAIIMHNRRDFPDLLMPHGVEVMAPSRFALTTVELDPALAIRAVSAMADRAGRRGPTQTPDAILDVLRDRYGMNDAVEVLRDHL